MSKETFDATRYNQSNNKPFEEVLEASLSRRSILKGGLGVGAMTAFGAFGLSGCNSSSSGTSAGNGSVITGSLRQPIRQLLRC
jgi:secreted PhoX family phosphatase